MYSIFLSNLAEKQLKKLPKGIQVRIVSALKRCRIRPYAFVKKIVSSRYFRLRAGKYRIILDIQKDVLMVFVVEVGHRKDVYK